MPKLPTPTPRSEPQIKLRTAQVRILKVLARSETDDLTGLPCALRKSTICERVADEFPTAARFQEWMADPLGTADPANRPRAEERAGYPSLLTLGLITTSQLDIDGQLERSYRITRRGMDHAESLGLL